MVVEEREEAGEEVEDTEMEAETDGTEEVDLVRVDNGPTWTRTQEAVDNGTVLLLT